MKDTPRTTFDEYCTAWKQIVEDGYVFAIILWVDVEGTMVYIYWVNPDV